MRRSLFALAAVLCCGPARADSVYDFVNGCEAASLDVCFTRIRTELDRVRETDDHHAFCIPPVWGGFVPSTTYPVSVLDYIKLRLSAARIGRAGDPADAVIRDVLAEAFPCQAAARRVN